MLRIVDFAHHIIKENIKDHSVIVDMTAGNGNDTQYLEEQFPNATIYAFDIQEEAVEITRCKVKKAAVVHDTHLNVDKYVSNADLFLFNLGYLPGSDSEVVTTKETTIKAVQKALDMLNKGGLIIIVVYIGHIEGYEESIYLMDMLKGLDNLYDVYQYKLINKIDAPYVQIIKRK